jgi:protoheme IX farnesyltransferase
MYREDYSRAGIRMLPVIDSDGLSTARQILITSLVLIPISIVPRYLGMSGNVYLIGALLLGIAYFYSGIQVARNRTRLGARRVLLASIVYLPVLYGLMVADGIRL